MKILILLLLTFNSFASTKFVMTDLRSNSNAGYDTFDTQELAIARLIEISKIKNDWRIGEFNEIAIDSLYSKQFKTYDKNGFENGEITKYYHPINWSYSFLDATQEVLDKKKKSDRKKELKEITKTKDLTNKEINEYLFD